MQFGGGNPVRTLLPVPATVAVAHVASSVEVDTTNFDGNLSGSDTTVQAALETLDDLDISAGVITSDSAPSSPNNGDLWWESDTGILFIYYDNFWVEAVSVKNGVGVPSGGEAGYSLVKSSDSDYATGWSPVSHNYIINGAFDIAQRGTSITIAASGYDLDRWNHAVAAAVPTGTIARTAFSPADLNVTSFGDAKYFRRTTITANNGCTLMRQTHKIENVETLAGQTVTLSFWAKADGEATGKLYMNQNFGSGGSSGVVFESSTTTYTTSWTRYTYTATVPSISGKTVGTNSCLEIYLDVPTTGSVVRNGTYDIWGVQLEAGSIATPFKRNAPSLQGELAACQRYYQRIDAEAANNILASGMSRSTTVGVFSVNFTTGMRNAPQSIRQSGTASEYEIQRQGPSNITASVVPTHFGATKMGAYFSVTVSSGLTAGEAIVLRASNSGANAFLAWESEL